MTRMRNRLLLLAMAAALLGCSDVARRGDTVLFASGADLQSINPLLTLHPLARQVQRYVLFTTLVRYDSAMTVEPYLARRWAWSPDQRTLTFVLHHDLRWHDDSLTTARDAAWTLNAARDSVTGYPRWSELREIRSVQALDDTTLVLQFRVPQARIPDVFTDLAILPAHLLGATPHAALRQAPFNEQPVGNGPFRFVSHEANRRWVFLRNDAFPASLGGPPLLKRFIVVVVDEPATKLAALTSGELDFAGIQPAHAAFVRRNPALAVLTYPLYFSYGIVFNARKPPFNDLAVRQAVSDALDRQEIVDGYLFGFGMPAWGPISDALPAQRSTDDGPPSAVDRRPAFTLLTVGSGEAALEQLIQVQLARAGFTVHIRQMELSAFLDRVYGPSHDFEAAVLGIPGDPEQRYLKPLLALAGIGGAAEPVTSPKADAGRRAVESIFRDSMPVAFLYHARGLQGMNRRVQHVRMDLRGELPTVAKWSVR